MSRRILHRQSYGRSVSTSAPGRVRSAALFAALTGSATLTDAFNPKNISNLLAWYDMRVCTQGAGIVTALPDQSGNGKDAVFPVSQNPSYTAANASYNNLPTMGFATTKRITLPDLGITTGAFSVLFMGNQGNVNADFFGTTDATPLMRCFNSTTNYGCMRDGLAPHDVAGAGNNVPNIMIWTTSGTAQSIYVSAKTAKQSNNNSVAADLTGKTLLIGNYAGGVSATFTMGGPMAQFLVYGKQLSATEVNYLLTGFGALAGISIGA